jgi:hypothetical protein
MRMLYNFLLFTVCLDLSGFLLPYFIALPSYSVLPQTPTDIASIFSISNFAFLGVAGAAIGLAALLLRQGTYALYAMLLAIIGIFLPIVSNFLLSIPILLNAIIPASANPIAPLPNPISLAVMAIMDFAAFMFFAELMSQRNIS